VTFAEQPCLRQSQRGLPSCGKQVVESEFGRYFALWFAPALRYVLASTHTSGCPRRFAHANRRPRTDLFEVARIDLADLFGQGLDRRFDLLFSVLRSQKEPQAGRIFLHRRMKDRLHIDAAGKQRPGEQLPMITGTTGES